MDDFRRDEYRRDQLRSTYSPMPPRSRSERVGPSSRGARAGRPGSSRQPKAGLKRFFNLKWLLLVLLTSVLLVVGGCSAVMLQGQEVDLSKMTKFQNVSVIYDAKGQKVADLGNYKREYVKLEDVKKVNPLLPLAFVKVEDVRFYDHNGVDYRGLARAVWTNIKSGGKAEGASTITMQVAGNVILENREKTYSRKIKEIATAWNIEAKYDKDDILEAYLNYIYLGNGVAGIQMASKVYFNKDVTKHKLDIHEIAFLAGLPKAPSTYNPFGSKEEVEAAYKRREKVLREMAEENEMEPLITEAQMKEAMKKPLVKDDTGLKRHGPKDDFMAYKELVLKELSRRYSITADDVQSKQYLIYTGLNPKLQRATDKVLRDEESYKGDDNRVHENLDAGAAIIDVKKGLIAAIGGGRHYGAGKLIQGAYGGAQPGSTIKPLTVFTPAIEASEGKINEYSMLPNNKRSFHGYTPKNYNGKYGDDVTMEEAVKKSLNVPTVYLLDKEVKLDRAFEYGNKLGLNLQKEDMGLAPLALGGTYKTVTPLNLARAYTVFPTYGKRIHAFAVEKVTLIERDEQGKEIGKREEQPQDDVEKVTDVFSKKAAWYMHRMLYKVVNDSDGTGHSAKLDNGQEVAGKTGTTQNNAAAWFAGYTPRYVATVVVFNTDPKNQPIDDLSGGHYAAPMFKRIFDEGLVSEDIEEFKNPGVEDPEPPFKLEKPRVDGKYIPDKNIIRLKWNRMSKRVKFQILRSEDNGQTFSQIGEAEPGKTTFDDSNIQPPQDGGGILDQMFGGGQSKTYWYKVVAIDTEATDPAQSSVESDPVPVEVKAEKKDEENPGDENGNGNGDGNNGGGGGDTNFDENNNGKNDYQEDLNNNGTLDGDEDQNGDGRLDGDEDRNDNQIPDRYDPVGGTGGTGGTDGTGGFGFKRKRN